MHTQTAFVLTLLVLAYAVISGLVKKWYVAPALIFMVLGMALGPFGLHVLDAGPEAQSFAVLAQLALTVILFNQAAMLNPDAILSRGRIPLRLLAVGIPVSLILGTITATLMLPVLPWWEAVCLAAVLAPTEVALIEALLDDRRIPGQVRHALSVESGCNDGIALAALLPALALASVRTDPNPGQWALFLVRTEVVSLIVGVGIGALGGLIIAASRRRGWMSDTWAQLATVALALLCFEVGEHLHASGFVTAFAGGVAFASTIRRNGVELPTQVPDAAAQLLELMVFAVFGAFAAIAGWRDVSWRVLVFAVLAVFGIRLVAVLLALVGTGLSGTSRVFIGWFGPRGIGTLVLGLLVIERGELQQTGVITQVVVVAVTISLVMHSVTAPVGIRECGARSRRDHDE